MLRSGLFSLFFLTFSVFAITPDIKQLKEILPPGSQFALSVIDSKTGNLQTQHNANIFFTPASTQKLVTALASSLYLPEDFRFETTLYSAGDDLILHFGGDPLLKWQELKKLLLQLKKNDVKQIRGDIWLDDSIFTGYDLAVGLPWDGLGVCYSAPASAITLENNCVQGSLRNKAGSSKTSVFIPEHQPIEVSTTAISITKKQKETLRCDLEMLAHDNNSYQLSGCIEQQEKPFPLMLAVQNPSKYTADVIQRILKELDIKFDGKIYTSKLIPTKTLSIKKQLASHFSIKRDDLLEEMLMESNNLVADNLLKIIGYRFNKTAGSFSNGVAAVKEIIFHHTRIDLKHSIMVDGSGLSRNNRMTVVQMSKILQWIYNNPKLGIIQMLPIAGKSGTLKYRPGVRYKPIQNNLQAKSGSLFGSYNLAGVLRRNGHDLLVVQFVNNYYVPKELEEKNKYKWPITRFEKKLYETLLIRKPKAITPST